MKNILIINYRKIKVGILKDLLHEEVDENYFINAKNKIELDNIFTEITDSIISKEKYFSIILNNFVIKLSDDIEELKINEFDIDMNIKYKYIDGIIRYKNEEIFLIDLSSIIKDISLGNFNKINIKELKEYSRELNKAINDNNEKDRNIIKNNIEDKKIRKAEEEIWAIKNSGNDKESESDDEYLGTEEDKKRIFEEIERISESLKISDVGKRISFYLKNTISFTKTIFFLYILLITVSGLAFGGFLIYSKNEEIKRSQKVAKIESIEAILIKELKRKQEEEKKKLESMLSQVQDELTKVNKEKEEFLKNQDKILEERQKKIYEEYLAKLEEQKKLLKNNTISKEEYDKIVSEINSNYNKQMNDLRNEVEKAKQEYLSKVAEVEKKLQQDKEVYQNQIKEKEKNIEETKSQISSLEKQLEEEKKKSQELEKKLSQVQIMSTEELKIQQNISDYLLDVSNQIRKKDYDKAIKKLNDFKDYLTNSQDSKKIDNERRNYYVSLVDTFSSFINKLQNEENYYNEKVKLLTLANDYFKNKRYEEAFNTYRKAFSNYFVATEIDKQSMENFIKVSYLLIDKKEKQDLENEASKVYEEILRLQQENKFKEGIDLCRSFIKNYSFSSNLPSVIDIAYNFQKSLDLSRMDNEVIKLLRELNSLYETGDYNKAKVKAYDIILKYPGNSYTKQVIEILKRIDEKIAESLKNVSQTVITAQTLIEKAQFEILGRVIFYSEDTEVLRFRIEKIGSVKVGDELKVYKVDQNNNYIMIAIIKVTEVTNDVAKAVVISKKENISFGNIISK
ncbi:MAG: hypothetical protein N3A58_06385 [Spirochaetes bacterium]|nr:hypothetical protein [Spirochaetota bacterium]